MYILYHIFRIFASIISGISKKLEHKKDPSPQELSSEGSGYPPESRCEAGLQPVGQEVVR